jgi:hypothetical protein
MTAPRLASPAGLLLLALLLCPARADWPQFRGPNATGLAPDGRKLPDKIGPAHNVVWKLDLPPGHSSPVVHGDRLYLTAVRD